SWMAVSPVEEAQIGHYHQLKREYPAAWQRYERAGPGGPNPGANAAAAPGAAPINAAEWLSRLFSPRGIDVFQYHCLTKLGRPDEARARLERFRESYPPELPAAPEGA